MSRKEKAWKIGKRIIIGFSVVAGLLTLIFIVNSAMNVRVLSEKRAKKNAVLFVTENKIDVKRLTCAGDTIDPKYKTRDGYGSCALATLQGEKIMLQCPADWIQTLMGAKGCKELFMTLNLATSTNSGANTDSPTSNQN